MKKPHVRAGGLFSWGLGAAPWWSDGAEVGIGHNCSFRNFIDPVTEQDRAEDVQNRTFQFRQKLHHGHENALAASVIAKMKDARTPAAVDRKSVVEGKR